MGTAAFAAQVVPPLVRNEVTLNAHTGTTRIEVRSARRTARTFECPGCFASLRSEQGAAPLAPRKQLYP